MTQGRLYKSARATGPMADDAILALPDRPDIGSTAAVVPHDAPLPQAPSTPALRAQEVLDDSPTQVAAGAGAPDAQRLGVSDFDHIFANESVALDDDDDLFPWERAPGSSRGAVPAPPSTMAAAAHNTASSASSLASELVSPVSTNPPADSGEGRNTPVVTYRPNQPRIRLTFAGAVAGVVTVTVAVGLLEAIVSDYIGTFTAVMSLTAALAATWYVAAADRMAPTLAYPVAWLVCALIPGQFTAPPSGSFALTQVVVVLGVLGSNAISIILGTTACYVLARLRPRLQPVRA